jgi:hypothetical protein
MSVKGKHPGGRPTKYSLELAEEIARELTHSTVKKACETVGISEETYYVWVYEKPEFSELSTKARKTKAINHFSACEEILVEMKDAQNDEDFRPDIARVRLDFHLRLAGKANQGLFGDTAKNQVNVTVDNKDVNVPKRVSEKEWMENK